MTTLADRARQLARQHPLQPRNAAPATALYVALATTRTVDGARRALGAAALDLLERLAGTAWPGQGVAHAHPGRAHPVVTSPVPVSGGARPPMEWPTESLVTIRNRSYTIGADPALALSKSAVPRPRQGGGIVRATRALLTAVIPAVVLALTGCASTSSTAPPAAFGTPAAASTIPGTSPSPAGILTGPAGTAFTVTPFSPDGTPASYSVTLTRVDEHATLDQYSQLRAHGDHLAAAEFTVTGSTGQAQDDANNDAGVIGSDGQVYDPATAGVTEGTDFSSGVFSVSPGLTDKAGFRSSCPRA